MIDNIKQKALDMIKAKDEYLGEGWSNCTEEIADLMVAFYYSLPDIPDGLYFKQKIDLGSRTTSVPYWVGKNPEKPVDIDRLIAIMSKDEKLASYLMKLQDENSDAFQKAKLDEGGYVKLPLKFYNFSAQVLATIILRFMYEEYSENETRD